MFISFLNSFVVSFWGPICDFVWGRYLEPSGALLGHIGCPREARADRTSHGEPFLLLCTIVWACRSLRCLKASCAPFGASRITALLTPFRNLVGISCDSCELAWALWDGLGHLLGCLGLSWKSLGAFLNSSWALLAASWICQGSSWALLSLSERPLRLS